MRVRPSIAVTGALVVTVLVAVAAAGTTHANASERPPTYPAAAPSTPASGTPAPARIAWKACPDAPGAECGTLRLPIDWSAPRGAAYDMAVGRRKATDPKHRIGALVINPGGPGAAGVGIATAAHGPFGAAITSHFDLVGFDPRGVGASHPITCERGTPRDQPATQAQFTALVTANRAMRAHCRATAGPLYDHVDTLSVARDVEALRIALGEKQLNFFGASYGSVIGQQYAEQFGGRIRAMVLDGNLDHGATLPEFLTGTAADGEDGLRQFAAWCEHTSTCAFTGRPVLARWAAFLTAADQHRLIEAPADNAPAGRWMAVQSAYGALVAADYPGFAQWLAGLRIVAKPSPAVPDGHDDVSTSIRTPVLCEDWAPHVTTFAQLTALIAAQRAAAPNIRYSEESMGLLLGCTGWDGPSPNPPRQVRLAAGAPILLVNPGHDPATGIRWAQRLQQRSPGRFALVRWDGNGHTAYVRSACVRTAVETYLVTAKPTATTACPAAPS
ncbi:MAG: hypothetical protein QOD41_3460 [Cryptosporangiaceae bacterium]|nr:hypothetical protein [Cryptosporangiaceae bacterium]